MKDLIIYPNEDDKIKIEFDIIFHKQKYLPSISKDDDAKENNNMYDLNINVDEISKSDFDQNLSEFEKTNYKLAAALTSASLAFVGGGSLAAGGLGMAGGTAILTGGGALIGLASSSATTIATVLSNGTNINILDECSKVLTKT